MKRSKFSSNSISKIGSEKLGTNILNRVEQWLNSSSIEQSLKDDVLELIARESFFELRERFYRDLEFGTGGLRGIVGSGSNRMNNAVIRRATQGFANYIRSNGESFASRGVVIAYDSRLSSREFAEQTARVFAANQIPVFLFDREETTPCLSFSVRHLKCAGGICITASHNPAEYNGYKVYWENGAQIVDPHDKNILAEINLIENYSDCRTMLLGEARKLGLVKAVPTKTVDCYYEAVSRLQLNPHVPKDLKIVYTPLHGTGAMPVKRSLKQWGFERLFIVPEQEHPDGNFPTVRTPNPEEPKALKLALQYANKIQADVVLATDPDSDRLAIAVKDKIAADGFFKHQAYGEYVLLNGNQTGALMLNYILENLAKRNQLNPRYKAIKTIVTSDLQKMICESFGVGSVDTLTGFKWIAAVVNNWERKGEANNKYLFGAEESFGYMPGDYVRDKDGIGALCQAVELCATLKNAGITPCQKLLRLFESHGAWQESLISINLDGEAGLSTINKIMDSIRQEPMLEFAGTRVIEIRDYQKLLAFNPASPAASQTSIRSFPKANVIQIILEDMSKVSLRPSGTEPKIKFYLSVCTQKLEGNKIEVAYCESVDRIKHFTQAVHSIVNKLIC